MLKKVSIFLLFVTLIFSSIIVNATKFTGQNWMSFVNENMNLSQLSLPGTHNSCARIEHFPNTAKCQNNSISEQLNMGVRFLDIRCRHIDDAFAIHHGVVYQHMNFADVLNECNNFLRTNPTECVIMSVKEEHEATNKTRSFDQTFDSYIGKNPNLWYLDETIPTLAQAKGKIVLLRRFSTNANKKGIPATRWADNDTFIINNNLSYLKIQDEYNVNSIDTKWTSIYNLLNEAKSQNKNWLYINYSSGYTSFLSIPNIKSVSKDINPKINNYFINNKKGRYGIIAMDFADETISKLIINTNFDN